MWRVSTSSESPTRRSAFRRAPRRLTSKITLMILSIVLLSLTPSVASSAPSSMFELTGGLSSAVGGSLPDDGGLGGRLMIGWGGHLSGLPRGAAVYGYTAASYDHIEQRGAGALSALRLSRDQLNLQVGVRSYLQLNQQLRAWFDLGMLGLLVERSEAEVIGVRSAPLWTHGAYVELAGGLQYKLSAGLLLSLGYYYLMPLESSLLRFAERALLSPEESGSFGRGRIGIGLGWFF